MPAMQSYKDSILFPKLVSVTENLTVAQFEVMKLIPAEFIIDQALDRGDLAPGGTIVEVSSGTFALALALVAHARGLKLKLVTIDIDPCLLWRLKNLGAEVHIIREPDPSGSIQKAQLARLQTILDDNPGAYWCAQYRNADNPKAYAPLAEYFLSQLSNIDVLVGPVGTGGSMVGTSSILRKALPSISTVGVDSNYSVTFIGCGDAADAACKYYMDNMLGLGSRVEIPVMDHTQFDWVHWVPFRSMVAATHELHQSTGLLSGPTGGGSYLAARWIAEQNPDQQVLAFLPDMGLRYVNTIFNPSFVEELNIRVEQNSSQPKIIKHIEEISAGWCAYHWDRQSKEALAHAA